MFDSVIIQEVLKEYYVIAVVNQFSDKVCLPDANSDMPALSFMRPALVNEKVPKHRVKAKVKKYRQKRL